MRFDKVVVMGANKAACECLRLLCKTVGAAKLCALETAEDQLSMLMKTCIKNNVDYRSLTDKNEITDYLGQRAEIDRILIVSANNRYIFKQDIISRPNVEIINFHYALLPDYRGMNIPSWVIYNGESRTGITWHYVTEKIDHGSILAQKTIDITPQSTAFDVTREVMRLSGISFGEFYQELLERHIEGKKAIYPKDGKLYLFKDLPNGGCISTEDPIDLIDRTLRAYDYRGVALMPELRVRHSGNEYGIVGYKIEQAADILGAVDRGVVFENDEFIIRDSNKAIRIKVKVV